MSSDKSKKKKSDDSNKNTGPSEPTFKDGVIVGRSMAFIEMGHPEKVIELMEKELGDIGEEAMRELYGMVSGFLKDAGWTDLAEEYRKKAMPDKDSEINAVCEEIITLVKEGHPEKIMELIGKDEFDSQDLGARRDFLDDIADLLELEGWCDLAEKYRKKASRLK